MFHKDPLHRVFGHMHFDFGMGEWVEKSFYNNSTLHRISQQILMTLKLLACVCMTNHITTHMVLPKKSNFMDISCLSFHILH